MRHACLALVVALSGCYSITDGINSRAMSLRDCCDAQRVWLAYRADYVDCVEYPHYFGEGFKAGYRAVSEGGQGCPPPLPPRKYWSVCYQNEAGKLKILNWYNGHAQGVVVAQRLGVQDRNKLVTGSDLYRRNCPVEIVIDPPPAEAPLLEEEGPHEMLPGESLPQPAIPGPSSVPNAARAPAVEKAGPPVSSDSVTDSSLPSAFPLPPVGSSTPPAGLQVPASASKPIDEPKPGLPAPPTVQSELPRPGEHPRTLSITLQNLWPASESTPWFELVSEAAVVPTNVESAPAAPGRVRLATLDGSVDVTRQHEDTDQDEESTNAGTSPREATGSPAVGAANAQPAPQPPDSRR